jgi:hypothetical protein
VNRLVLVGLALTACTRERPGERERPPPQPTEHPAAAPREPRSPYACPTRKVPPVANAILIHDHIRLAHAEMPLRWITSDDEVYELGSDPLQPTKLGAAEQIHGATWDDKYRYRAKCYKDCIEYDSMGVAEAIERIDRVTGERKRLTKGHYGLGSIVLHGEHVYWGLRGHHQAGGAVWRVSKRGGEDQLLRFFPDRAFEDWIQTLSSYRDGVLVEGLRSVGWISASGEPRLLFEIERASDVASAVLDDGFVYIAESDDAWQREPSGAIHRVALVDGARKNLTGPLKSPEAIATFGPNIYFVLRNGPDIWVLPKSGGKPRRFVTPDAESQCDWPVRVWADERGLFWLAGWPRDQALYFLPWPSRGAAK